jgi:hypothetical protein
MAGRTLCFRLGCNHRSRERLPRGCEGRSQMAGGSRLLLLSGVLGSAVRMRVTKGDWEERTDQAFNVAPERQPGWAHFTSFGT